MADGCMDAYADDVIACGACGIITEPYTELSSPRPPAQGLLPGRRGRQPRA